MADSRLVVRAFTVSIDGFGAGPDQSLAAPMGTGTERLHGWFIPTRTFRRMVLGQEGGTTGTDDQIAEASFDNLGAWVMGRNMFTHERGDWSDADWRGWWGEEPPYHCDVFVLTHHPRDSLVVGETTFHFVTSGLDDAVARAKASADGRDVRLGGGVSTLRQALTEGLVDEMHIAVSPILLGRGEALWQGLDLPALGYGITEVRQGEAATHLTIGRIARVPPR